jgi:hypothetical protein
VELASERRQQRALAWNRLSPRTPTLKLFGYVTELCLAGESELRSSTTYHPSHPFPSTSPSLPLPAHNLPADASCLYTPTARYRISIMPGLTSASGVLGFLSDEEPELKVFALQTLNDDIDTLWTEVAGSIGQM